jgi:hypothetical protein
MGVAAALALALAWAAPPPDRLRLSIDKAREGVLVGVTEVSVGVSGRGLLRFNIADWAPEFVLLLFIVVPRRLCPVALGDRACDGSMFISGSGWLLFEIGLVTLVLLSACEGARGRALRNEAPKPSTVDRSGGLSLPT